MFLIAKIVRGRRLLHELEQEEKEKARERERREKERDAEWTASTSEPQGSSHRQRLNQRKKHQSLTVEDRTEVSEYGEDKNSKN